MPSKHLFRKIKQADAARPGFPGEPWLVLVAGIASWWRRIRRPA